MSFASRTTLHSARFLLLGLGLLTSDAAGYSQAVPDGNTAQGWSPQAFYNGGQIDNVSPLTGNLFLSIPVLGYPQRGGRLSFEFNLFYNSNVWYSKQVSGSGFVWTWGGNGSPQTDTIGAYVARDQHLGHSLTVSSSSMVGGGNNYSQYLVTRQQQSYYVRQSDGAMHYIGDNVYESCTQTGYACPSTYNLDTIYYYATDGTGFVPVSYPYDTSFVVKDPAGNQHTWPGGFETVTDPNGNSLVTSSTGWTDTLGNLIPGSTALPGWGDNLIVASGTANPTPAEPNPGVPIAPSSTSCPAGTAAARSWIVPSIAGASSTYYLCYKYFNYQTAFNIRSSQSPYYSFGEASSSDQGARPALLLSALVLPNSTSYLFDYDSYLSLKSLSLPTGGALYYTWQNVLLIDTSVPSWPNQGPPARRSLATRTIVPGGTGQPYTWIYSFSSPGSPAVAVTTDPAGNDVEYAIQTAPFRGAASSMATYLGCAPDDTASNRACSGSGTLFRKEAYTYTGTGSGGADNETDSQTAAGTAFLKTGTTVTLDDGSTQTITDELVPSHGTCPVRYMSLSSAPNPINPPTSSTSSGCYNFSQVRSRTTSDWGGVGSTTPGGVLSKSTTTYLWESQPSYLAANILSAHATDSMFDATSVQVAQTNYGYDETGSPQGTLGSQTSSVRQFQPGSSSASPLDDVKRTLYNNQGMPIQQSSGAVAINTAYDGTGAFPQTITYPTTNGVAHSEGYVFDPSVGLMTSHTDQNGKTTTYGYATLSGVTDPLRRVQTVLFPDAGRTRYSYIDSASGYSKLESTALTNTTQMSILHKYDGLGRETNTTNQASSVAVDVSYDFANRKSSVSNPYVSTSDPTYGNTIFTYGPNSTSQRNPDNTTSSSSTSGRCTTYADEAQHTSKQCRDGLGRLQQVQEATGDVTSYTYNGMGDLMSVNQHGLTRRFSYDSFSRLITAFNPESGLVCYGTWSGGAVGTGNCQYGYDSNSNLRSKTDARNITTSYTYDGLNRLIQKSFSDGTPSVLLFYDETGNWASSPCTGSAALGTYTQCNTIGRLSRAGRADNSEFSIFGYDPLGRMTVQAKCISSLCGHGQYLSYAGYDLAGHMTDLLYPDGRHIQQSWNGAGQLGFPAGGLPAVADANSGTQYVETITYNADSTPNATTLGNGMVQTTTENKRLQVQSMTAATPLAPFDQHSFLSHTYSYTNPTAPTGNNGNVWGITDALNPSKSQSFTYDALDRINSFSRGTSPAVLYQQFQIDSFGNMSQLLGVNWLACFDPATNRLNSAFCTRTAAVSSPGPVPPALVYDNAGNLTGDTDQNGSPRTYVYDAESKLNSIASSENPPFVTYTYGADGNRAQKLNADGTLTRYINFNGQPIAEANAAGTWTDYIYANGKKVAMEQAASSIWMHGTSGAVEGVVNLGLSGSFFIATGDKLSWFQDQQSSGGTAGGVNLTFENGWQLNGACTSCSAQPPAGVDQNGVQVDKWNGNFAHTSRAVDLSAYAGHTVTGAQLLRDSASPGGDWDLLFSFISIVHANGQVDTIYDSSNPIGLNMPSAPGMINNFVAYGGVAGSNTRYYVSDHLGSAQMEFAPGGWPLSSNQFAPFGEQLGRDTTASHYKFTGKERDAESGLDYFGARYYGSMMGRMMSPDPVGGDMTNPQSLNRYSYVLNNPLRFTDPTGLYVCRDGQDCSAFEKTLAGLRNSKNADVSRAANAYGAAGEKNGVTVGFADLSKSGQDGVTKSSLGQGSDGKLQAQSDVTINSKASGAGYDSAVGHEGSHVADAQAVVGSIVVDEHGNFTVGNNITRYQSEQRAYGVTNAILSSEGVNANEGCNGCNLGQNTMQGQVPGVVDRIMNSGNNYMSGGQHMGPRNQGGSVVNGLDLTPKATVPQVPK